MAKKYLSLDEAASQLGLTREQVMRYREQGEIRGFADRGSWKFREQDIEEFLRSHQSDSSPDMPIITGDSSSSVLEEPESSDLSSSDSDVRLFFDESLFEGDDSEDLVNSGSDLRLTGDSGPNLDAESDDDSLDLSSWDSDIKLSDSDSDVKLVGAGAEGEVDLSKTVQMSDSDSDVLLADESDLQLSDSDSDVRLSDADDLGATTVASFASGDSDSDVKLMGSDDLLFDDSDSDVKLSTGLDKTDSDIRLAEPSPAPKAKKSEFSAIPDDSDLKLINKGSGVRQPRDDSGISLEVRGSGIGLDADESGISLEIDSGISLDADDSGISLESFDSGAKLGDDSGISLDAGDSGISLDLAEDSGISLSQDDMNRTMPMNVVPGAKAALAASTDRTTQFEIPAPVTSGRDSEFELAGLDDDDDDAGTNTSVLTFEDDEEDSSRTIAAAAVSDSAVDEAVEDEEYVDEDYDDSGDFDDEYEDGDDLDVQDAEDFDDEDFEAGQSQVIGPAGARVASRVEADWGVGVKVLIGISTVLSILCAVIGIELVRTMWLWTQPGTEASASAILQMVGGLF